MRFNKPFNPILGETYELIGDGWKFLSEQVSHHPPISASYAESDHYIYHTTLQNTTSLSIKGTIDAKPVGL
jgi:hypothetical protein